MELQDHHRRKESIPKDILRVSKGRGRQPALWKNSLEPPHLPVILCSSSDLLMLGQYNKQILLVIKGSVFEMGRISCLPLSRCRWILQVAPEEDERKKRRRERNKIAAAKCRNKKKEKTECLQKVSVFLPCPGLLLTPVPHLMLGSEVGLRSPLRRRVYPRRVVAGSKHANG